MERKNIAFQYGIHRSPLAANDGELAECINLEVHNGELTPSVMPQVSFSLEEGDKLLFVHKSGNYKNYIIQRGPELCWFSDKDKAKVTAISQLTPTSIHSVGNTLVVLTENHMEYILYKSGSYKPIGSKPPFCSISFGLQPASLGQQNFELIDKDFILGLDESNPTRNKHGQNLIDEITKYINKEIDSYTFNLEGAYRESENIGIDETDSARASFTMQMVNKMTESVQAAINQNKSVFSKFGAFTDSFYLRYAYRMYDGSHYMHSAPIFFPLSTEGPETGIRLPITFEGGGIPIGLFLYMPSHKLDYKVVGFYNEGEEVSSDSIKDWEDIIDGIDVFVSKGISPYNTDAKVFGFTTEYEQSTNILYCGRGRSSRESVATSYKYSTYADQKKPVFKVLLELNENDDYKENIEESSLFYKIASFNGIEGISNEYGKERALLSIEEDVLSTLEQQEKLGDDYDSHNEIIPSFAHVYNGRLNISGIRTKLFNGYPMESMLPYTYDPETRNYYWYSKTTLEIEGQEVSVVSKSNIKLREKPAFIYYPNPKVKSFTLNRYDGESGDPGLNVMTYHTATFKAEAHKLLNGSFYLSSTYGIGDTYTLTTSPGDPQPSGDPYVSYPNKIYTSEVNNPFFFPLSGRNSIGTGEIIAITSNTKAISPGQFGEYPLIVFSTDGVWAMQVGEEGLYFGVHPISKDICTNPNVLQTDGPVLFATDNGLHSIVTDTVANISKIIKGKPESVIVPEIDTTFNALYSAATDTFTLTDFIRDALFAYDYANNRAIIYNPAKDFAYSYSLESGMFSKLVLLNGENPVKMEGIVKAYPEVYMQAGNDIYTFVPDKDNTTGTSKGIIVTRTMTFADPLAMKVINDVRLIYHRSASDSKCRYAMYVSNDGHNWKLRTSLRGHSFKYFRFVVFTELTDTDALQGMSVMFDYRRTNKLR